MTNRTDTFDRASGPPLGNPSDGGSAWSELNGTWAIGAAGDVNRAKETSGSAACIAVLESSISDADVQVTARSVHSGTSAGIAFRVVDINNYLMFTLDGSASGVFCRIFEVVGGSASLLATGTHTVADSDVAKVNLNGTAITCSLNGVSEVTFATSRFQTATKHGLRTHGDTATTFDDFSITALGGGGGTDTLMGAICL